MLVICYCGPGGRVYLVGNCSYKTGEISVNIHSIPSDSQNWPNLMSLLFLKILDNASYLYTIHSDSLSKSVIFSLSASSSSVV